MNHQIKKMFESIGYPVIKLTRKRVGIFDVNDLKSKGSDCPLIKDLRNHIIKYKLRKGFVDNK